MMIAVLMASAVALALQVQWLISPFAAAWLPPFLAAVIGSLYTQGAYKRRGTIWWAALLWLLVITVDTFFIRPVPDGAATMWILAALPITVLCLHPAHIQKCLYAVGAVLLLYALGILAQQLLRVGYVDGGISPYSGAEVHGRSWPVADPNNGACILNFGCLYCFSRMLRDRRWVFLWGIFLAALLCTHSRTGCVVEFIASLILLRSEKRIEAADLVATAILAIGILAAFAPYAIHAARSLMIRVYIWEAAIKLVTWRGIGWGMFEHVYPLVRTETGSAGYYAHNDALQFLIEGGIQALAAFCLLVASVIPPRRDIRWALMLGMTFVQASVEFQFYLPVVSLLAGLALTAHFHSFKQKGDYYGDGTSFEYL